MLNALPSALRFRVQPASIAWSRGLVAVMLLLANPAVPAANQQPHDLVNAVIEQVMVRIGETSGSEEISEAALLRVFEEELSPHFAFGTITKWIAGKRWLTFSEAEHQELLDAVRVHIVHVYASLLARGRSVEINVEPNSVVLTKSAKVAATLASSAGRDFNLEFRLLLDGDTWKLYDLAVDGLSFARSLRAELSPIIAGGGITGLRNYLSRHHNTEADAAES